jgi:hypothetical protein
VNGSVAQCQHLLSVAKAIFVGLDDSHRAFEPQVGTKTAGWLIGHLAVTGDGGLHFCGRRPLCPKEWRVKFSRGSQPSANPDDYPPMEQMLAMFRGVYTDLCIAATEVDVAGMEAANPYEPARAAFPTVDVFVAWMLTGHLGYHLGQLAGWRAAAGLGRILPISPQT